MSDEKLVSFKADDSTLVYKRSRGSKQRFCKHQKLVLDEKRRLLECEECGDFLEPFDYLLKVALKETRLKHQVSALNDEIRIKSQELNDINRRIKNAKQRLKRRIEI